MFYRYAYLFILAAITLALVLARLSYTVTLKMTHAVVPATEIARLITILDLPEPRSVVNDGRNIILHFNPFISNDKKNALESLLETLDNSTSQGNPLAFNLYLNEPDMQLFNYMLAEMGNRRNLLFTLNTDNAIMNLIPYTQGTHEKFECDWAVGVTPALPNFNVAKSTFTRQAQDESTRLPIKYTLTPEHTEHLALTPLMKLTSSTSVSFVIDTAIAAPPLSKNNLLVVQRLCNKALLKQGNAMVSYVLFPVLTSELRGATFHYDLSNDLMKL